LNFQLAAVLLSIGLFTFVEYRLRKVLADILDACVAASKCRSDSDGNCITQSHKNTERSHYWVKLINVLFSVFAIILLAYLGVLLDISFDQHSHGTSSSWYDRIVGKWIGLHFFGHLIVLIWFIVYLILK